jgi:translation initiation factor IF-3
MTYRFQVERLNKMERFAISTSSHAPSSSTKNSGPRVNRMIRGLQEVRLIDESGENIGVVSFLEALNRAESCGLDLVEFVPNADPPLCKILDYGRHKFHEQKKAHEARKNQKQAKIKEIKLSPRIADNDYKIKLNSAISFLEDGDKVKVTIRFRGRELLHRSLGFELLERFGRELDPFGRLESAPSAEGARQIGMIIVPKGVSAVPKKK